MKAVGGLKLALKTATRDDRRVRFARVFIAAAGGEDDIPLVTDSCGRLRYRLTPGEYWLRLVDGDDVHFSVDGGRWTAVRVQLP